MDKYEQNILAHIEKFGCSVTSVFDPEDDSPPFSYSIGIARSAGAPELIVVGLESKLSHWLINEYHRRVRAGEAFVADVDYADFLKEFPVRFGPVARSHREEYLRSACWLHGGPDFEARQLIWPSKAGAWPWDPEASDAFRHRQPLLANDGAT